MSNDRFKRGLDRDHTPKRRGNGWVIGIVVGGILFCGVLGLCCVGGIGFAIWTALSPTSFPPETESYSVARRNFQTKLVRKAPAPQPWDPTVKPRGVDEVEYLSGNLRLKAWVDHPEPKAVPRPAVLFLHGGFAFGEDDWEQCKPFRDAGFVVMIPMLRGENGLPGDYSMFYNEVDDVLAAADSLAKMPHVDSKHMYVAGHSVGGTLTLLAAMTTDRFKAAASFSGSPDQVAWSRGQPDVVPFDPNISREYQMRSPLAFPRSFKCPVRLYYGSKEILFSARSQKTAQLAKDADLDVAAVSVPGDHMSAVAPAMAQAIKFFKQK